VSEEKNMSFHDLPQEVIDERIAQMRREAEVRRLVGRTRQGRRTRSRRRWILRRQAAATRLAGIAQIVNEVVGSIISPAWPTDRPRRYAGPGAGR